MFLETQQNPCLSYCWISIVLCQCHLLPFLWTKRGVPGCSPMLSCGVTRAGSIALEGQAKCEALLGQTT